MSSLSASVENLSGSDHQSSQKSNDSSSMCLELALEARNIFLKGTPINFINKTRNIMFGIPVV
uniref:Uncharacterized protein n=1 Tax=Megaselia scalaris TaxID=36166 RepID=T1GY57_MEGSC